MEKTPDQMAVEHAFRCGAKIEWRGSSSGSWVDIAEPLFDWRFGEYRVKSSDEDQPLYPHSETQDEIPWSAINPRFKHSAREPNGMIFVYENAPELIGQGWSKRGFNMRIDHILNCAVGSVDWAGSAQERNEKVWFTAASFPRPEAKTSVKLHSGGFILQDKTPPAFVYRGKSVGEEVSEIKDRMAKLEAEIRSMRPASASRI